jgi:hypothetical protein
MEVEIVEEPIEGVAAESNEYVPPNVRLKSKMDNFCIWSFFEQSFWVMCGPEGKADTEVDKTDKNLKAIELYLLCGCKIAIPRYREPQTKTKNSYIKSCSVPFVLVL